MASSSSPCLNSRIVSEVSAAGLKQQRRDSTCSGGLLRSLSSDQSGLRAGRGTNTSRNQLRFISSSSSSIIGGDSFKNERFLCIQPAPGMPLSKKQLRKTEVQMSVNAETAKILTGSGGAVLEDVPHLTDWLPDLPVRFFPNQFPHPS
jgi:hypothetical protein